MTLSDSLFLRAGLPALWPAICQLKGMFQEAARETRVAVAVLPGAVVEG